MLKNNLTYLKISSKNPEPILDEFYEKGELVIPINANEFNNLTKKKLDLINCIGAIDVLKSQNYTIETNAIQDILRKIIDILDTTPHINYSAFCQFFMVYNVSFSLYSKLKNFEKINFIYNMVCKFIEKRHFIYNSHGYSNSILQVMSDNYSHKRNSKTGIDKLLYFMPFTKKKVNNINDLFNNSSGYILPDKGDKELFEKFLIKFQIEMKSRANEQNKLPDILFFTNGDYFIVELKTMKEGGGSQNKQAVEFINFIRYQEKNPRIHYIAYLDGLYSNTLFEDNSPKIKKQREEISYLLKTNQSNFFVNTAGMKQIIEDLFI